MASRLSLVVVCSAAATCAVAAWFLVTDIRAMTQPGSLEAAQALPAGSAEPTPEQDFDQEVVSLAIEEYFEIVERPVFVAGRRPPDRQASAGESVQPLTVTITGILITPGDRMALINPDKGQKPRRIREGDSIEGWKVTTIEHRRVTFRRGGIDRILQIKIEAPPSSKPERARGPPNRPKEVASEK